MLRTLAALVLLTSTACDRSAEQAPADDDPVVQVADEDPAMNRAIADARAKVAVFEQALAAAEAGRQYSVKKPFPRPGGGHEHMWLVDVKVVDGGFEGRLDNDPKMVD